MKYKRIWFRAILILLLCISCVGCTGRVADRKIEIAMIAKATASDFWHNVFNGVNSAATEYNVSVTIQGPEREEDYASQNAMIEEAVANGADAIVFSAIDYYNSVETVENAVKAGVKIVVIDSTVNTDKISVVIGTDNYAAGERAAEAAMSQGEKAGCERLYIGLVNYDIHSANGQERERGFRDRIAQNPNAVISATINVDSTTEDATEGAERLMEQYPEINVLVGFNEWMTLGVGCAIENCEASNRVVGIGFDCNVVSVGMLETGEMDALIVQNPFAMGYFGVKCAYELISGEHPGNIVTATTTLTKANMFDESSQKTYGQT